MKRFNILAMFRELEVERDKARVWAARWKRAAKAQRERAGLNDDRAELEQELELNASMLARQCDLAREAETERDEAIREKHRAWASLDHAIEENRKVERERDELKQQLESCQAEAAVMRQALEETEQALKEVSGVESLARAHGHRYTDKQIELFNRARDLRVNALSTTVGTDLLRELEALREVARLAESLVNDFPSSFDGLREALDKLEEVNRE